MSDLVAQAVEAVYNTRETLVERVAAFLHAGDHFHAAKEISVFSKMDLGEDVLADTATELCYSLLTWCLNSERYDLAASMLWGETLFTHKPRCTRMVWEELRRSSSLMMMGSASMSKSYATGVWLLLDWIRDPEYTNVNLVGPSEDHLKDNLFTHLVTLHRDATLPLPGVIADLFIGLDPKKRKSAIRGIVIPAGKKPAGRLQGRKQVPRKKPHPKFGKLTRMRIFIDELEKVPTGIFKDLDNVFANFSGDAEGFKIIAAFNPEDINGPTAQRCEPPDGWEKFDPELHEVWTSKRGWRVLRLDAAKCENVIERRVIYPGLQNYEGFCRIIQNAGGTDTPGYWTMARGCFPKAGAVYSVISSTQLFKLKGEFMFQEAPDDVGACDLALEGGDAAEFAHGKFGKAVGYRLPPTPENPKGQEFLFSDASGNKKSRWALQLVQIFPLPKAETVAMSEAVKTNAIRLHIKPGNLMLDRTGNGAGVHDLLKKTWSEEVRGVNYSESPTERKILEEDTKKACDEYDRVQSELWFALKKWAEFGFLKASADALTEELLTELGSRRYAPGKGNKVEKKEDYKSRGNNKSPNKADGFTLLVHLVRAAFLCIPSALDGAVGLIANIPAATEPVVRIDETNRFEDIDREDDGRSAYGETFQMN